VPRRSSANLEERSWVERTARGPIDPVLARSMPRTGSTPAGRGVRVRADELAARHEELHAVVTGPWPPPYPSPPTSPVRIAGCMTSSRWSTEDAGCGPGQRVMGRGARPQAPRSEADHLSSSVRGSFEPGQIPSYPSLQLPPRSGLRARRSTAVSSGPSGRGTRIGQAEPGSEGGDRDGRRRDGDRAVGLPE
jgi:hypothetical protein